MSCCGGKPVHKPSLVVPNPNDATVPKEPPSPVQKVDVTKLNFNPAQNLIKAAREQNNILLWFKDGVTGLAKCFVNDKIYTDEQIVDNRDKCRGCEHSTKNNGKLFVKSQCMAPDPDRNGAACGCFVLCKTQVGKCPLNKWTALTVNGENK